MTARPRRSGVLPLLGLLALALGVAAATRWMWPGRIDETPRTCPTGWVGLALFAQPGRLVCPGGRADGGAAPARAGQRGWQLGAVVAAGGGELPCALPSGASGVRVCPGDRVSVGHGRAGACKITIAPMAARTRLNLGLRVDLNHDAAAALAALPGVTKRTAQRIVEHRRKHGPFKDRWGLVSVKGIGWRTASRLGRWVLLGPARGACLRSRRTY